MAVGNISPTIVQGNGNMAKSAKNTYAMNATIGTAPYGGFGTSLYNLMYAKMMHRPAAMPVLEVTSSVRRRTWCNMENVRLPTTRATHRYVVTVTPFHWTRQSRSTSIE